MQFAVGSSNVDIRDEFLSLAFLYLANRETLPNNGPVFGKPLPPIQQTEILLANNALKRARGHPVHLLFYITHSLPFFCSAALKHFLVSPTLKDSNTFKRNAVFFVLF